jgi:hypothetical protein
MTAFMPQNGNEFGNSLVFTLCGEIIDIRATDAKIWLVIGDNAEITSWMIPLLCPICGEAWHFDESKIDETLSYLRSKLIGYFIGEIHYQSIVSQQNAKDVLTTLYSSSDVFGPLIKDVPDHFDNALFPAVALMLEKREPLDFDLSGSEDELRSRYEILPDEDFDEAIASIKELQEEEFDVVDDLMLLIHPVSILETVEVFNEDLFEVE